MAEMLIIGWVVTGALGGYLLTYPMDRPDLFGIACGAGLGPFALLCWALETILIRD